VGIASFSLWVEKYLFYPGILERAISVILLPLTLVYCLIITIKKSISRVQDFKIKIISVGNLIVGGSGKTPIIIELAKRYKNVAIILRGYNRKTKGLIVLNKNSTVYEVGDEAIEYKLKLPNTIVIVSEDRAKAILKAKQLGAKIVFLDDGFRFNFVKTDILIKPKKEPTNLFCLPSGGYKDLKINYLNADIILKEGVDFIREVSFIKNNKKLNTLPPKFILVSAISKADRLLEFIPTPTKVFFFQDHYFFTKKDIQMFKSFNLPIVTTFKDYTKLKEFKLDIILLDLKIVFLTKAIDDL